MRFVIVGSGSKGNATLVYSDSTLVQIDMGVPLKRVAESLSSIGKTIRDEQGVLITHEHCDHVSTLPLLHSCSVYASKGTLGMIDHEVYDRQTFRIGDLSVTPFSVSHDAANPMGYLIDDGKERLAYATDTGYLSEDNLELMKNADYYIIESNHDLKMLLRSDRPATLKNRIASDLGHLSNVDSAVYMSCLVGPRTKQIWLAHISEECNTKELALRAYQEVFKKQHLDFSVFSISCAEQWKSVVGGDR